MLRKHKCFGCSRVFETNKKSKICDECNEYASNKRLESVEEIVKNTQLSKSDSSELNELAKEIFKLLTIDLIKAAMERPDIAKNLKKISEANCDLAFRHAELYMEKKINV